MTRNRFAEVLLSRILTMDGETLTNFGLLLVEAQEALDAENTESAEFHETAEAISELLFPESMGDLHILDE